MQTETWLEVARLLRKPDQNTQSGSSLFIIVGLYYYLTLIISNSDANYDEVQIIMSAAVNP